MFLAVGTVALKSVSAGASVAEVPMAYISVPCLTSALVPAKATMPVPSAMSDASVPAMTPSAASGSSVFTSDSVPVVANAAALA